MINGLKERNYYRFWNAEIKEMKYFDNFYDIWREEIYIRNGKGEFMQCIGRGDEDGKLIYEQDIVKGICSKHPRHVCEGLKLEKAMGKELIGTIEWSNVRGQFYFTTDGITFLDLCFGLKKIKILGNIYQTPEILETASSLMVKRRSPKP